MTNEYFEHTVRSIRNTTARAEQVNASMDLVADGFGKLPPPQSLRYGGFLVLEDTGSVNEYQVSFGDVPYGGVLEEYLVNMMLVMQASSSNTGASTINVNGLGAVPIRKPGGGSLDEGDIIDGGYVQMAYDGSVFRVINYGEGRPGEPGTPGTPGDNGLSLEYNWEGTELGIRLEGEPTYDYVDLKGEPGEPGEPGGGGGGSMFKTQVLPPFTENDEDGSGNITVNLDAGEYNSWWVDFDGTPTPGTSGGFQINLNNLPDDIDDLAIYHIYVKRGGRKTINVDGYRETAGILGVHYLHLDSLGSDEDMWDLLTLHRWPGPQSGWMWLSVTDGR